MPEPYVISIYEMPTVDNICNQTLREIIKLPKTSMAHVTMEAGNVSLLHEHSRITEIYYILEGEGVLYHGKKALKVERGTYLAIHPKTPHKLRNTGEGLEHLVISVPQFDPTDLSLVDDSQTKEPYHESYKNDKTLVGAMDGALIYELFSEEERRKTDVGLAVGVLPPQKKAKLHFHKISDEVYYIFSGKGKINLDDSAAKVEKGSMAYIPANTIHGLENLSAKNLEVLCLSSPAYSDKDFILA